MDGRGYSLEVDPMTFEFTLRGQGATLRGHINSVEGRTLLTRDAARR